jgi:hypothetical protein
MRLTWTMRSGLARDIDRQYLCQGCPKKSLRFPCLALASPPNTPQVTGSGNIEVIHPGSSTKFDSQLMHRLYQSFGMSQAFARHWRRSLGRKTQKSNSYSTYSPKIRWEDNHGELTDFEHFFGAKTRVSQGYWMYRRRQDQGFERSKGSQGEEENQTKP